MKLLDALFGRETEETESDKSKIARELRRLRWLISTGIKRNLPIRHEDLGGKKDLIRDANMQVGAAYDDFPQLNDPEAEAFYKTAIDDITNALREHGEIVISVRDFSILNALGQQKGIRQITLVPTSAIGKPIIGVVRGDFLFMRIASDEESRQVFQKLGIQAIEEIISPAEENEK